MTAKRTAFDVKFNVSQVEDLAKKLKNLTPEQVGSFMVDAVNETTARTYELARKTMLGGINLTDNYLQRRMQIEPATGARPTASIVAAGAREDLTNLSHYGAMQLTKAGGKKGDTARGISAGQGAAGISVEIIKGERKSFDFGFTLPGKKDSDGNLIVFARKRDTKKIVSRRGPAVYMLFRVASAKTEDQVYGDLQRTVVDEAERLFSRELS